MKKIKYLVIILSPIVIVYFAIGYLSSGIGWYGYQKWKYRKHSTSIEESVKRSVFVKKLNYQIDSFYDAPFKFEPFIEKGFKWGHNTSDETVPMTNSKFPYQFSYNYRPNNVITILIPDDQFVKFDSLGECLQNTQLPDTIILKIEGEGIKSGIIKVW